MKKVFSILAISGLLMLGNINAQETTAADTTAAATVDTTAAPVAAPATPAPADVSLEDDAAATEEKSFTQALKDRFIEGDPLWMAPVLLCLILGLAIAIERIIFLYQSTTNSKKLLSEVEDALKSGGVEAAKDVCRNTPGPVASIFYQGLDHSKRGIDNAEKSVIAYGGVQMGQLEKNVSWISLFIALAPMLGFLGTVIGMIQAFDKIEAAGNMDASLVAGGIKVALLTTVFGLIVAMILQVFYNYITAKIDAIVNDMEDASISLVDILLDHQK
jgi:biopolymer transport protein ExbB